MDNKEIVDKIKKLLSLAKSGNEHEARLAAEKASELLIKYNLSLAEIEKSQKLDVFDGKYGKRDYTFFKSRASMNQQYIFSLLQEFFFIAIVKGKALVKTEDTAKLYLCWSFIGRPINIEIAEYIHDFLSNKFDDLWRDYKKMFPKSKRKDFIIGLYSGLHTQLSERRKQTAETSKDLILSEETDLLKYMRQVFDNNVKEKSVKKVSVEDLATAMAGREAGQKLQIIPGISTETKEKTALGQVKSLNEGRGYGDINKTSEK